MKKMLYIWRHKGSFLFEEGDLLRFNRYGVECHPGQGDVIFKVTGRHDAFCVNVLKRKKGKWLKHPQAFHWSWFEPLNPHSNRLPRYRTPKSPAPSADEVGK